MFTQAVHPAVYPWIYWDWASLVAHTGKNLPAMQDTRIWPLGQEDLLKKGMATHSNILAWRIPWKEEPGGLQSMGLQRLRHNWEINTLLLGSANCPPCWALAESALFSLKGVWAAYNRSKQSEPLLKVAWISERETNILGTEEVARMVWKTAVSAGLTPLRVPQSRLGKSAISRDGRIKCKESESRFTSPFYLASGLALCLRLLEWYEALKWLIISTR